MTNLEASAPAPQRPLDDHDARVHAIAADVRDRASRGERVHVFKGGVHHVVPMPGDRRFKSPAVDVSGLDRILSIDPAARRCVAEPGVSFARVVRETLKHGLVPAVVPELEGITLGGAVAGCSIESMSFVRGGFHDSCLEYELVSGAGEIIRCSRDREPLVFEMVHGSYGTLAILTRLTFELVAAKPFVRLTYERFSDATSFYAAMLAHDRARDVDFIDAIIHAEDHFVLCLGTFVEKAPYTSDYRHEKIFWESTRERAEDYLTTPDYFFRYDTECHWLTRTVPPLTWGPVRKLFGKWFLGSENLIRWSKRLERILALKKRPDVVVDVFIPGKNFLAFWRWYARAYAFYPLWIVPYRAPALYPWIARDLARRLGDDHLFIDCAVYGKVNADPNMDLSEILERKTHALDGFKTLISRNHYDRERFWSVYDEPNYLEAKHRLDPRGVFPGIFEKFHHV